MKEICENIFCFWRKWCNKSNTKEVSIESTKMIPKSKEQQELYTNLFSPSTVDKEKNVFKFSEAEMSTALTIEEIIFPLKYLNLAETNPSFHFTFTREKIMSFIEDEIKMNNSYTSLINTNGFDIYIKESGSIFNSEFPKFRIPYD